MAAVGVNNRFVLNITELQNVITGVSGLTPVATLSNAVSQIQEMVIYNEKRIATNTISNYNTTPIQVTTSLNMASGTSITLDGTSVTSGTTGQVSTVGNGPSYVTFISTISTSVDAITFAVAGSTIASFTGGGTFAISGPMKLSGAGYPAVGRYLTCMDTAGRAEWHDPGSVPSDARLKQNIRAVTDYGTVLETIRGVRFDWIAGGADIGVIAQDVRKVLPEAVEDGDVLRVSYHKIIPVLVEAIKDLRARVSTLEVPVRF
jgi:hypothetical protein